MNKGIYNIISFKIFVFVNCPKIPETEFINMKKDAVEDITLGLSAFNKKSIGLKNIPPPIPTIPEIKPKTDPINKEGIKNNFLISRYLSLYDLLFINNRSPANERTINSKISNISFRINSEPPKKAIGTDPIKNGINKEKL